MKSLLTIPASFLALLFFAHNLQAQTPLPTPRPLAKSDRQFWNETQFRVDLSKRWTLNFLQFTRVGNEARSDTRTGLGLLFRVNRHYAIQPTYVYQYAHPGEGRKVFSHRLYVDHLLKFPVRKRVTAPIRLRTERIVRHGGSDYWNFRIRPGIEVLTRIGDHWLTFFANNESFYDTRYQAWTRQRMTVGVSKKFSDKFTADFFYQQQFNNRSRPGNLKVFGTTFRFNVRSER
jgi:hypothetical protein